MTKDQKDKALASGLKKLRAFAKEDAEVHHAMRVYTKFCLCVGIAFTVSCWLIAQVF